MLRHLAIDSFALVDSLEIEFRDGFTAITGETGAGKSILLDALQFLLGWRGSAELVRTGAERALVQGEFDLSRCPAALEALRAEDLAGEGDALLLRRELRAGGRSRIHVNGHLATKAQLERIGEALVEFHAQGSQQDLASPERQRAALDAFAGAAEAAGEARAAARAWRAARRERARLAAEVEAAQRQRDFLEYQVAELRRAALEPGELGRLEAERRRLANLGQLLRGAQEAHGWLSGDGDSLAAVDLVGRARRLLETLSGHDAALAPLAQQLADAEAQLDDAARTLDSYLADTETDPARFEEVDARISAIRGTLRKHGPTEEDAVAALERLEAELETLETSGDRLRTLEREESARAREWRTAAARLTALRAAAAGPFAEAVLAVLRDLSMPRARLEARLAPAAEEGGDGGAEEIELLFSANPGEEPRPLRRIASGGELSRVMLALRSVAAERDGVGMMVFDEVDAGLSGAASARVGARLAALAKGRQVLCVTHQPAVAALADAHLNVAKLQDEERTVVVMEQLEGAGRTAEIARLLDGGVAGAAGRRLAEELLGSRAAAG
ncbi:MAG: DNA repair protein RecN [Candidatus Sumerlaeia bacterium]|nr:DNA repair protein RecN [Candidatus Sumerlaeia bacterium]